MRFLNPILTLVLLLCFAGVSTAQESDGGIRHPEKIDFSKSITLYPNPATEYVHIQLGSLHANKIKLTLYNIIGNEVQIESEVIGENELRVKVKELSSGYYLLAVRDEQVQFRGTYKFVKR